jgi:hypothetical protein
MCAFDLKLLNDKEFELLVCDIIAKREGATVERFKLGKDQGVDGRFYVIGGLCVIQAKHWERSGLKALIAHLKSAEVLKVRALNPSRYIFATSVELSPADKAGIVAIFTDYIKSTLDVLGNDDIQSALLANVGIQRNCYKLWLSSFDNLRSVFMNGILGRSEFALRQIENEIEKYVITDAHAEGLRLLDGSHVAILTGEPGVGKTTVAEHLAMCSVAEGFDFIKIESSVEEAEDVWSPTEKQVFFFDDFLGKNYLESLRRNEDSRIVGFIRRVNRSKNKRFILTSRSAVLNRGKQLTELYRINNIDKYEFELLVGRLRPLEKARILYNHIWFGMLPGTYVDEIYLSDRYMEVVKHRNYNPRLISYVTDVGKLSGVGVICMIASCVM